MALTDANRICTHGDGWTHCSWCGKFNAENIAKLHERVNNATAWMTETANTNRKLLDLKKSMTQRIYELQQDNIARTAQRTDAIARYNALCVERSWRPIDTAPRDGTHILVADFTPGVLGYGIFRGIRVPFITVAHYWNVATEEGFFLSAGLSGDMPLTVTHWMPLPTEVNIEPDVGDTTMDTKADAGLQTKVREKLTVKRAELLIARILHDLELDTGLAVRDVHVLELEVTCMSDDARQFVRRIELDAAPPQGHTWATGRGANGYGSDD